MSMTALSLSALPGAASLAGLAARSSAQAGSQFLSMLASLAGQAAEPGLEDTTGLAGAASANEHTTLAGSSGTGADLNSSSAQSNSLMQRTHSWGERFLSWLRQQPGGQKMAEQVDIELSLDDLDRPEAIFSGPFNDQLQAALDADPTWLQEFRELALDRADELGQFSSEQRAPLALKISQQSDQIGGSVVTQWK
ncbi:MAG: hypothetical protein IT423_20690 [Pirellulaceae bacterium]|nr:hypothetical protein [Pirellulaceae bacterium]